MSLTCPKNAISLYTLECYLYENVFVQTVIGAKEKNIGLSSKHIFFKYSQSTCGKFCS